LLAACHRHLVISRAATASAGAPLFDDSVLSKREKQVADQSLAAPVHVK
jgi:hypothetical protein